MKSASVVTKKNWYDNGTIHCINSSENSSQYWNGSICSHTQKHDGHIAVWVCPTCVSRKMPSPEYKPAQAAPQQDPNTGMKRGRGRPKGALNKKTIAAQFIK